MGLGTFPELSLAHARKRTVEARELVAQGLDPKEQRDADRQAKKAATEHTFQNVATAWFELKKDSVTTAYAEDIWRSLTLHVFPDLHATPISEISAPQVIKLLKPLETKGSLETVKRRSQTQRSPPSPGLSVSGHRMLLISLLIHVNKSMPQQLFSSMSPPSCRTNTIYSRRLPLHRNPFASIYAVGMINISAEKSLVVLIVGFFSAMMNGCPLMLTCAGDEKLPRSTNTSI